MDSQPPNLDMSALPDHIAFPTWFSISPNTLWDKLLRGILHPVGASGAAKSCYVPFWGARISVAPEGAQRAGDGVEGVPSTKSPGVSQVPI